MNATLVRRNGCVALIWLLLTASVQRGLAQAVPPDAIMMVDAKLESAEAARLGKHLYLSPKNENQNQSQTGQLTIPRMGSSLTALRWLGKAADDSISLKVEQDYWIVQWKSRPEDASVIVLSFDSAPTLMSEVKPTRPAGDGSIYLKACEASTAGEKIRYEPQTFKNTVGYWVGKQDFAQWQFQAARPGTYNVGILQGCGAGQGGSHAKFSLLADTESAIVKPVELEFEVLETGGFQNFQWRHVGQVEVAAEGTYTLKLEPVEIKKNALMDIRAIHLTPLPR